MYIFINIYVCIVAESLKTIAYFGIGFGLALALLLACDGLCLYVLGLGL